MSGKKPTIPSGTRDFSPAQVRKRQYLFDVIRAVFQLYGFRPLETPAMENLATLTGKYGEEGDKLIFRILNSGDFLSKAKEDALEKKDSAALAPSICDRALRYDLTIPFARYVVMNRHELVFPFRRYQIQPVWRADRPQKGRYREFWQCDADIIGTDSLLCEAELIQIYKEVFARLHLPVKILVNHRKLLSGFTDVLGIKDQMVSFTIALDKLDKIGKEGVLAEFDRLDFPKKASEILAIQGKSTAEMLEFAAAFGINNEDIALAVRDLKQLLELTENGFEVDLTLARGLDYYTGMIVEVKPAQGPGGSLGGGGRYADLTGVFGAPGFSGVGISFGADRIFDSLEENNLFPDELEQGTKVLFINFGQKAESTAFRLVGELRKTGIPAELYPENEKMKKQMKYANDLKIPFVCFLGEEELASEKVLIKNMGTGEQTPIPMNELSKFLA